MRSWGSGPQAQQKRSRTTRRLRRLKAGGEGAALPKRKEGGRHTRSQLHPCIDKREEHSIITQGNLSAWPCSNHSSCTRVRPGRTGYLSLGPKAARARSRHAWAPTQAPPLASPLCVPSTLLAAVAPSFQLSAACLTCVTSRLSCTSDRTRQDRLSSAPEQCS